MMGAPGTLIPAEVPSSQLQNCGFAVRGCAEIIGQPEITNSMPYRTLSDCTVGMIQTKGLLDIGSQTKPDEINHVNVNETGRFEHTEAHECSSHSESSPAENMRVKNVSKYVLNASKNPEFPLKLHNVLLESGASPPPDLLSDMNPRDGSVDKVNRKTVQAVPNWLLLGYEKSLIPPQGVGSASDTRICQSADQLAEQKKELHTDAIEIYDSSQSGNARNDFVTVSDRDSDLEQSNPLIVDSAPINRHKTCKEKCLESSLPKVALPCKRHNSIDCFCDDDENGLGNKVGPSFNNIELGKDSALQINETVDGDCILCDGKSKKVNPILGEGTDWEVQWEDLRIGERIGIGKYIPRL